jgi:hypothetical protein
MYIASTYGMMETNQPLSLGVPGKKGKTESNEKPVGRAD